MSARASYPTQAKVRAAVEQFRAAREAGLDVAALEVKPDGTIRVFGPEAFPAADPADLPVEDEIARWRAKRGK